MLPWARGNQSEVEHLGVAVEAGGFLSDATHLAQALKGGSIASRLQLDSQAAHWQLHGPETAVYFQTPTHIVYIYYSSLIAISTWNIAHFDRNNHSHFEFCPLALYSQSLAMDFSDILCAARLSLEHK